MCRTSARALRPGRAARATTVPTPEVLSSAPGAGGTVSACAMTMTRHRTGESRMPMTSRETPLPGTVKRSKPVRRPAARKRAVTAVGSALGW